MNPSVLHAIVIEDNEDDALLMVHEVQRNGYDVRWQRVQTSLEFRTALTTGSYDVILADYALPRFSAPEALDILKGSGLDIPFLVISGTIGEDTAAALIKSGANDYVMKDNMRRLGHVVERELREFDERKRKHCVERALAESEERYRLLYQQAPVAYQSLDFDGNLLEVNDSWVTTIGYTREEVIGRWFGDFLTAGFRDKFRASFLKFKAAGEITGTELQMVRKDGSTVLISFQGRIGHDELGAFRQTYCVLTDITERRRAEEEKQNLLKQVQKDKDMLDLVLNNMTDEVWLADASGKFTLANPAACKSFVLDGTPDTDIQTLAASLGVLRADGSPRPIEEAPPLRALAGEAVIDQEESVRLPQTGELRHRLVNASAIRDADGVLMGCVSVVRDITELRRAGAEKEALQAQLLQAQKMEAIGTLAGGVAHDFNNLLTGILGNIALMRTSLPAADPLLENLNAAETAARQAADLTKGLLTFSRSAMILPVPMRIADALDVTLAILKQSLPATVEIVRDDEQAAWNVLLDQSQMTQILLNLAVNARDAMQGKGTLTIRTRNEVLEEDYVQSHAFARTGEFVHVSVADTGPGIPPEILEHLFEPFHTTKPAGSGTGLGLSIVYGAVKQADGWVTAESPEGGGAVFDIFLPRCLDKPTASGVPVPVSGSVCSGTVLVVEDEPVVCAVAQALLTRSGYTALTAVDGASALAMFRSNQETIDLILLDMTMPGMTTEDILQQLRAMDAHVPILLTSGYTSGSAVTRMLEAGTVQGFLPKPYEVKELLTYVMQLLSKESRRPAGSSWSKPAT